MDNPDAENRIQINTNISNTDLSSKEEGGGSTAVAPMPPIHPSRKKYDYFKPQAESPVLGDSAASEGHSREGIHSDILYKAVYASRSNVFFKCVPYTNGRFTNPERLHDL